MKVVFSIIGREGKAVEENLSQEEITALFQAGTVKLSVETGPDSWVSTVFVVKDSQLEISKGNRALFIQIEEVKEPKFEFFFA